MFSTTQKYLIVPIILFSLFLCCGAAWHAIFFDDAHTMENHTACGMGNMGTEDGTASGHVYTIITKVLHSIEQIIPNILVVHLMVFLLVVLYLHKLIAYLKKVRDRYGGFRFFSYITLLFRLGIWHPKTF